MSHLLTQSYNHFSYIYTVFHKLTENMKKDLTCIKPDARIIKMIRASGKIQSYSDFQTRPISYSLDATSVQSRLYATSHCHAKPAILSATSHDNQVANWNL